MSVPATPGLLFPGNDSQMSSSSPGIATPAGNGSHQPFIAMSSPGNAPSFALYASNKPQHHMPYGQYQANAVPQFKGQEHFQMPPFMRSNSFPALPSMPDQPQNASQNSLAPPSNQRRAVSAEPMPLHDNGFFNHPLPMSDQPSSPRRASQPYANADDFSVGLGLGFGPSPNKIGLGHVAHMMQFASPNSRATLDSFLKSQAQKQQGHGMHQPLVSSNDYRDFFSEASNNQCGDTVAPSSGNSQQPNRKKRKASTQNDDLSLDQEATREHEPSSPSPSVSIPYNSSSRTSSLVGSPANGQASLPSTQDWLTLRRAAQTGNRKKYAEESSEIGDQDSDYQPDFPILEGAPPRYMVSVPIAQAPKPPPKEKKKKAPAPKKEKAATTSSDADYSAVAAAPRDKSAKPPFSYAALIGQAILSGAEKKRSLADIYGYIMECYPFYRKEDAGWQNSIRHNLSLNECFVKTIRDPDNPGKGSLWAIAEGTEHQFANGGFVKKGAAPSKKRSGKTAILPQPALTLPQVLPPSLTGDALLPRKKAKTKKAATTPEPEPTFTVEVDEADRRPRRAAAVVAEQKRVDCTISTSDIEIDIEVDEPVKAARESSTPAPEQAAYDEFPLLTREFFASPEHPARKRMSTLEGQLSGPNFFLPAAHIKSGPSPFAPAFEDYAPPFNSQGLASPGGHLRGNSFLPSIGSPLRRARAGSSPPRLSARKESSASNSDDDEDPLSPLSSTMGSPRSPPKEQSTPRSPHKRSASLFGINLLGSATSSSRALQNIQSTPKGHSRQFTGFSTPGRTILNSSYQAIYAADPYDFGGLVQSELDRMGEDSSFSGPNFFDTGFMSTPRLGSHTRRGSSSAMGFHSPW